MPGASSFSPDYTSARARFRSGALALGWELDELPIDQVGPDGEPLTIDIARVGPAEPKRAVVVSSGLHGVEGYFGSAVQAELLEETLGGFMPPPDTSLVLLHALNPYGMAWVRRVNEDNIDLNRNLLTAGEAWEGHPDDYPQFDELLNPVSPPGGLDPFLIKAAYHIARRGLPAMKQTVAEGQYSFPEGLFFGGSALSRTGELLRAWLPQVFARAERVLHVDFHTGLGERGTYKLMVDHPWGSDAIVRLRELFGEQVEPWEPEQGVSYRIRGGLGNFCKDLLGDGVYDVFAAEFGTVGVLRVIASLRNENRAHRFLEPGDPRYDRAKKELMEVFNPPQGEWRDTVVPKGVAIVERAIEVLEQA